MDLGYKPTLAIPSAMLRIHSYSALLRTLPKVLSKLHPQIMERLVFVTLKDNNETVIDFVAGQVLRVWQRGDSEYRIGYNSDLVMLCFRVDGRLYPTWMPAVGFRSSLPESTNYPIP
jgi:hypothetical protein